MQHRARDKETRITPNEAPGRRATNGRSQGACPIRTLQDLLLGMVRYGDAPALIAFTERDRQTISFETLTAESLALAGGLIAHGIRPGTPVALFAPNSIEWVICRLALIAADALCVPVDYDSDAARLRNLLHDSGARLIFTVDSLLSVVDAACATLHDRREIVLLKAPAPAGRGLQALDDLNGTPPESLPKARDTQPVSQFYTSGSTGRPKPCP